MSTARSRRPSEPSVGRRITSWIWGFSPAWTLGFGTAPIMIFATVRLRSWLQGVLTAVYVVAVILMFAVSGAESGTEGLLYDLAIGTNLVLGTGHALVIRSRVFGLRRPEVSDADRQREALRAYDEEQRLREAAQKIVDEDPQRAIALKIGRIDVPRRPFPDGRLIDVNNVNRRRLGIEVEALGPYLSHLAETRQPLRGFDSLEDMSVALDLPPHLLDHEADRLVFLPRYERS